MTIALGIIGSNGIVLAADTEESIQGYMKRHQTKILSGFHHATEGGPRKELPMVAVSGAGDSHYLDVINEKMVDAVLTTRKPFLPDVQPELEETVKKFYDDHIIPFAAFPANERPEISLIVAAAAPNQAVLWTTSKNVVKKCQRFAAVGIGAFYAETLLNRLYGQFDAGVASALATFVMLQVKEHVPDCGKETQLVCIRQGEIRMSYFRDVRDLEDAFRTYQTIEMEALHYAIGGLDESVRKDLRRHIPQSRKAIMQLTSQMLKRAR
jgi:hypothetical protein